MADNLHNLNELIEQARAFEPIRVAVVDAAQGLVIETLRDAQSMGIVEPLMIGDPEAIQGLCKDANWDVANLEIIPSQTDAASALLAIELVHDGKADAVMKGNIHTDTLMHALLDAERGLRVPGQRVSHVFVVKVKGYAKLLGISDAAVNISPDLNAKAQILQNAIDLFHLLGVERPKVAVLSAVETINTSIPSTLDAACLTLMARRGQISGALIDGPLAFDNAISVEAAREKGIVSQVAGEVDILLVPDLVSGNILAKNLEYLADAVAAGILVGLEKPVVLTSRADPPAARLASLAIASLMHHRRAGELPKKDAPAEATFNSVPQPEHACCPLPG
ncbi:bifunctional enoyl-CoA hydratase/phosphate acetyltransferase [Limibacillus sp. MBR-115]|jgi:phosphotransacetylase|uniref:bifunctional enoyl-CoA hydratase/phosphate acetyltransferase n=1 Tax=Limibacillus sp. MBR-115 TaxID=3156465 RepID=UPI003398478C